MTDPAPVTLRLEQRRHRGVCASALLCLQVNGKVPPHSVLLRLSEHALTSEKVVPGYSQVRRAVSRGEQRVNDFQSLLSREPLCGREITTGNILSQKIGILVCAAAEELHQRAHAQTFCCLGKLLLGFAEHLAVDHGINIRECLL